MHTVPFHSNYNHHRNYVKLLKSIIDNDWRTTEVFLSGDRDVLKIGISNNSKTPLHVAVGLGSAEANRTVKKLLDQFVTSPEELETMVDDDGSTALHEAAIVGNLDAAKMLVDKHRQLSLKSDKCGNLPIFKAALYGHKELLLYLSRREVTPGSAFSGVSGYQILDRCITAGFYDVALELVENDGELAKIHPISHPELEKMEPPISLSLLEILAKNPCAFYSGSNMKFWQRFLYSCVPLKKIQNLNQYFSSCRGSGDIENQCENPLCQLGSCLHLLEAGKLAIWKILWEVIEKIIPSVKHIFDAKEKHEQVLQLLRCLCMEAKGMSYASFQQTMGRACRVAAQNGIHEIVEHILETYPFVIWYTDINNYGPLETAVLFRHENVYNLIYQMSEYKYFVTQVSDHQKNSTLHLVAKLAPPHRLVTIPGAALQMQRELQWFKEIQKFLKPSFKERRNINDKTPEMIFSEEHRNMVKEGETWMKGMANSCIIASSLLATVGFAAAITIPGGNDGSSGFPAFSKQDTLKLFLVSNAISLFSSVAGVTIFLSILTAHYAEEDFLYALPKRLIFGLVSLFLAITAMMIAFSAAIYLLLEQKESWILVLVGVLASLPVTLFITLQFPLLFNVIKSTYGPSIFRKQNERLLH